MQIRLYLRMLQSGWWLITLAALSALVVGLTASYLSTPMYRTTARFLISPNNDLISGRDIVNSLTALDKRVIASTYAEVLNSDRIYAKTSESLQIDPAILRAYKLSAVVLPEASVLELSASGPNPKIAALFANNAGQQGVDYILSIYQVYSITVLDAAVAPSQSYSPNPTRDAGLALALGLMVGALLAVVRGYLQTPLDFLKRQTNTDLDSGAYSRGYALRRIGEMSREADEQLTIGIIRLDGLQDLATPLPKPIRQRILRGVTFTLRSELRGRDLIARWDDHSFIAVLPHTSDSAAQQVINRICTLLTPVIAVSDDESISLSPQAGIIVHATVDTVSTLTERAEEVLEQIRHGSPSINSATVAA